jgi:predicted RNA-binding protein
MSFWILLTSKENWDIINKKNIWGVSKRNIKTIERMKIGDKCLIYIRRQMIDKIVIDPKIVAEYQIVSEVYQDQTKIFKSPFRFGLNEIFPYRIKIKKINDFQTPIDFKSLVPSLSFIKNKTIWSSHLQGCPMKEISESDYDIILAKKM